MKSAPSGSDAMMRPRYAAAAATLVTGGDEVRGQYIEYNSISENYTVTNSADAKAVPSGGDQSKRVRAIIQPKSAPATAPAGAAPEAPPKP